MATLPVTGSQISFGQVNQAFTNYTPGAVGTGPSPAGGRDIKLSASLGYNFGAKNTGTSISISSTFGGKTTPYGY